MARTKTARIGDKLIIVNGIDPLMYVDLSKKKLHVYKEPKVRFISKYLKRIRHEQ